MIHARRVNLFIVALLVMLPLAAQAQQIVQFPADNAPPPGIPLSPAPPTFSQAQIDQLLAPIALYPDPLVAQILMAATYPTEIVQADRWRQAPQNAHLNSDSLTAALEQEPWDPSVKSLVAFPQILTMMDNNLQWTEQLGDAFLAQQPVVMDSVQRLRQQAQAAGNLGSTPQQTVTTQEGAILIEPANPQVVFVPAYNPNVVYGSWIYPEYPPYYFPPPPGFFYASGGIIGFGIGIAIIEPLWGWDHWDWHGHRIDIDNRRFEVLNRNRPPPVSGVWEHDPGHRHGVPYQSPAARAQFQNTPAESRRNFRGFAPRTDNSGVSHSNVVAPARQPQTQQHQQVRQNTQAQQPSVPVFESFSRGSDVREQSQRGSLSRSSTPSKQWVPPQRQERAVSAPAVVRSAPQVQHAAPVQRVAPSSSSGGNPRGNWHDDNNGGGGSNDNRQRGHGD